MMSLKVFRCLVLAIVVAGAIIPTPPHGEAPMAVNWVQRDADYWEIPMPDVPPSPCGGDPVHSESVDVSGMVVLAEAGYGADVAPPAGNWIQPVTPSFTGNTV